MKDRLKERAPRTVAMRSVVAMLLWLGASAFAAAATIDPRQLVDSGFKVLVATNDVQRSWVKGLPAGKFRAMQRTGRKFFIYPDAPGSQVYVGGPAEYDAYLKLHPENAVADAAAVTREASAYRKQQSEAMQKATARDNSDPWLGLSWSDLGW